METATQDVKKFQPKKWNVATAKAHDSFQTPSRNVIKVTLTDPLSNAFVVPVFGGVLPGPNHMYAQYLLEVFL